MVLKISMIPARLPPQVSFKLMRKCLNSGDLERACHLFDKIPDPDLRAWTLLISAHTQHGFPHKAIEIYFGWVARNVKPDKFVLVAATKACAASADLVKAKAIHDDTIWFGYNKDVFLGNALVDMHGKCKCVDAAKWVFEDMMVKDVVSWTSMVSCYVNGGFLVIVWGNHGYENQ